MSVFELGRVCMALHVYVEQIVYFCVSGAYGGTGVEGFGLREDSSYLIHVPTQ
jgi:hypothetical protein